MDQGVNYAPLPGFPGYLIGDDGSVWSRRNGGGWARTSTWRRLAPGLDTHGYQHVMLRLNGQGVTRQVHRLVLEAFVGPCPPGMECCHFPDQNPTNNRLENLRWDTKSKNMREKINADQVRGSRHPAAKLNESDIRAIHESNSLGESYASLGRRFKVSDTTISKIINRKKWAHVQL